MTKRKLGLGSISLFLVVFAVLWAFTVDGVYGRQNISNDEYSVLVR